MDDRPLERRNMRQPSDLIGDHVAYLLLKFYRVDIFAIT